MKILLTTDFHIGFRPKSHVTTASAAAYQAEVKERALRASAYEAQAEARYNLGDLFDKFTNSEAVIADGIEVAKHYDLVLSGNHDVRNIEGSVSSIQIAERAGCKVAFTHAGLGSVPFHKGGVEFTALCHCYTQGDFEAAVRRASEAQDPCAARVLLLHCNIGDGHGSEVEADQSSLYLTEELQDLVCENFDLVLVGHEHNKRTVTRPGKKGRIEILGNHFPLSFGEMCDKFIHVLDTDTMELEAVKVWDSRYGYAQLRYSELFEDRPVKWADTQFLEITGQVKQEDKPALARAITQLWKSHPHLLAVKNSTEVIGADRKAEVRKAVDFTSYLREEVVKAGYEEELKEIMS